jgi:hypothetical protein
VESADIKLEDDVEDWSDVEGWRESDEEDEEERNTPAHRVPRPQASMVRPMVVRRPQQRQVVTARMPATKVRKPLKQPANPRTYLDHSTVWIKVYPQLAGRFGGSVGGVRPCGSRKVALCAPGAKAAPLSQVPRHEFVTVIPIFPTMLHLPFHP